MQFPQTLARFRSVTPRSVVETINPNKKSYQHSVRRSTTGQRWGFELTTVKLSFENAIELQTFIDQLDFDYVRFNMFNPLPTLGAGGGSPETRALIAKGVTSIPIDGLSASQTGIWKVGDFIQFDNHKKAYRVTSTINSNGTGQATASIHPALIADVPSGTAINFGSNVNFQFELESEIEDISFAVSSGKLAEVSINVIEVG
ncbi:hypothetical protein Q4575_05320 [Psychrosphaera sp. 1_MG-2023]|uniref:hypothetical protein n=1 Tax=Psychrosphaera sp. 1_MG-2023 TaxID=3062643 RepID=UPI0026E2D480|nr:hypothetical protein [Psychrosphaera sp. 1_MG-2023]MDO6718810.1 hypothetical protein [Psychrosphaera sp. 1_MG-2023]